jgi:hypothetical protein
MISSKMFLISTLEKRVQAIPTLFLVYFLKWQNVLIEEIMY